MLILRWYKTLCFMLLIMLPAIGLGFLYVTSDTHETFRFATAHGALILAAVAIAAVLGYAAYRSYLLELDSSLRYIAFGYFGFALLYSLHGIAAVHAGSPPELTAAFGAMSRFVMGIYVFIGVERLLEQRPPDLQQAKPSWWQAHAGALAVLALLTGYAAGQDLTSMTGIRTVEGLTLGISLLTAVRLRPKRRRSVLLRYHLIAQLLFAQTAFAFIVGTPWNSLWWFGHAISATGFMALGFSIIRSFEETSTLGRVYNESLLYPALRSVLQTSHEGFIMADNQGRISYANRRLRLFFPTGLRAGQYITDFLDGALLHAAQGQPLSGLVRDLTQGRSDVINVHAECGGESVEPAFYEFYAAPVMDEQSQARIGFLFIFRNRSEEERLDQMKNDLIGVVSHELRTPLASILGFTEIMLIRDVPADKRKKYLQTVHNEATRLSALIDDFLDIQRMESGRQQYHFELLDLGGLLADTLELWQGKDKHELRLELPPEELTVSADRERIIQVLHNLISNAIKYSPGADYVDLSAAREGDQAVIRVRDYGFGIPEDSLPHLFEKFYRVDSGSHRKIRGTGLGLAIVKEITDIHGGLVEVASRPGQGTQFTVRLPAYRSSPLAGTAETDSSAS